MDPPTRETRSQSDLSVGTPELIDRIADHLVALGDLVALLERPLANVLGERGDFGKYWATGNPHPFGRFCRDGWAYAVHAATPARVTGYPPPVAYNSCRITPAYAMFCTGGRGIPGATAER